MHLILSCPSCPVYLSCIILKIGFSVSRGPVILILSCDRVTINLPL